MELAVCNAGFVIDRHSFKIPKLTDFKTSFRRLNRIRRSSFSGALWHYTVTQLLGRLGLNKRYYGHFVALYAH
jgi:hypothetical protein